MLKDLQDKTLPNFTSFGGEYRCDTHGAQAPCRHERGIVYRVQCPIRSSANVADAVRRTSDVRMGPQTTQKAYQRVCDIRMGPQATKTNDTILYN